MTILFNWKQHFLLFVFNCQQVLYPDEGHGFARPDNRIDFNGRAELFLAKHLGGRAQEFDPPKGSTAKFPLLEREVVKETV